MTAVIIWTGLFQGKWVAYRRRRDRPRDRRPSEATCVRCKATTTDPGEGGWFYRRGELRQYTSAQLCPRCLEALRWRESSG